VARGGRRSDPGPPARAVYGPSRPLTGGPIRPAGPASALAAGWRFVGLRLSSRRLPPRPGAPASPAMVSAGDCRTSPTKPSAPPARRGGLQARTSPCSAGGAFWPRGPWAARGPRGGGRPPGKPAGSGGGRKRGTEPLWCAPGQAAWGKLGIASERDGPYLLLRGLVRLLNYGFTKKALEEDEGSFG
jgi:hypothetical protein